MRKKRQYIATALALAMVCNSVPVGVFADTQSGVSQVKVVQNEDTSSQATDGVLESDSSSSELDTTEVNESDIEESEDSKESEKLEVVTGSSIDVQNKDPKSEVSLLAEDQSWTVEDCTVTLSADGKTFTVAGTGSSTFNPKGTYSGMESFPWYDSIGVVENIQLTGVSSLGDDALRNFVMCSNFHADQSLGLSSWSLGSLGSSTEDGGSNTLEFTLTESNFKLNVIKGSKFNQLTINCKDYHLLGGGGNAYSLSVIDIGFIYAGTFDLNLGYSDNLLTGRYVSDSRPTSYDMTIGTFNINSDGIVRIFCRIELGETLYKSVFAGMDIGQLNFNCSRVTTFVHNYLSSTYKEYNWQPDYLFSNCRLGGVSNPRDRNLYFESHTFYYSNLTDLDFSFITDTTTSMSSNALDNCTVGTIDLSNITSFSSKSIYCSIIDTLILGNVKSHFSFLLTAKRVIANGRISNKAIDDGVIQDFIVNGYLEENGITKDPAVRNLYINFDVPSNWYTQGWVNNIHISTTLDASHSIDFKKCTYIKSAYLDGGMTVCSVLDPSISYFAKDTKAFETCLDEANYLYTSEQGEDGYTKYTVAMNPSVKQDQLLELTDSELDLKIDLGCGTAGATRVKRVEINGVGTTSYTSTSSKITLYKSSLSLLNSEGENSIKVTFDNDYISEANFRPTLQGESDGVKITGGDGYVYALDSNKSLYLLYSNGSDMTKEDLDIDFDRIYLQTSKIPSNFYSDKDVTTIGSLSSYSGINTLNGKFIMSDSDKLSESKFSGSSFSSVVINSNCSTIGNYAFKDMPNMRVLTVPTTITSVSRYAFASLDSVIFNNDRLSSGFKSSIDGNKTVIFNNENFVLDDAGAVAFASTSTLSNLVIYGSISLTSDTIPKSAKIWVKKGSSAETWCKNNSRDYGYIGSDDYEQTVNGETPSIRKTSKEFDVSNPKEISFAVTLGSGNREATGVSGLYIDSTRVDASSYTYSDKTVTLNIDFLKTLAKGRHTVSVRFNNDEETIVMDAVTILVIDSEGQNVTEDTQNPPTAIAQLTYRFYKDAQKPIVIPIDMGRASSLKEIRLEGTVLKDTDYVFDKDLSQIILTKEFLATVDYGEYRIVPVFNTGDKINNLVLEVYDNFEDRLLPHLLISRVEYKHSAVELAINLGEGSTKAEDVKMVIVDDKIVTKEGLVYDYKENVVDSLLQSKARTMSVKAVKSNSGLFYLKDNTTLVLTPELIDSLNLANNEEHDIGCIFDNNENTASVKRVKLYIGNSSNSGNNGNGSTGGSNGGSNGGSTGGATGGIAGGGTTGNGNAGDSTNSENKDTNNESDIENSILVLNDAVFDGLNEIRYEIIGSKDITIMFNGKELPQKYYTVDKNIVCIKNNIRPLLRYVSNGLSIKSGSNTYITFIKADKTKLYKEAPVLTVSEKMGVGQKFRINFSGYKILSFNNSNNKVATVSKMGYVTAKKEGVTSIRAYAVDKKGDVYRFIYKIKVDKYSKPVVDKFIKRKTPILTHNLELEKGKRISLNLYNIDTAKTKFTSSNKKVVKITSANNIVAKSRGKSTITVTTFKNDKKYTYKVVVTVK